MRFARENPKKYLAFEGLLGVGAGGGAMVAQAIDPYDEGSRVVG